LLCPALLLQVNEYRDMPVVDGVTVPLFHALFAGIVLLPLQLSDAQQYVGVFLTDHDNLIESPEVMVDLSVFRNTSGVDIGAAHCIVFGELLIKGLVPAPDESIAYT